MQNMKCTKSDGKYCGACKKNFKIKRYLSNNQFYQTYELGFLSGDETVLDALKQIKNEQDGSLAFRSSCEMGMCGSCATVVNGKPVLMCQTFIKDLPQTQITIEPMRNFPIIKDLAVDLDVAFSHLEKTAPYFEKPQRNSINKPDECIKCMLCVSACPVYGFNNKFAGPAAGVISQRYKKDLTFENGVYECSHVGECSRVCPKNVDPANIMQRLKLTGLRDILMKKHDA